MLAMLLNRSPSLASVAALTSRSAMSHPFLRCGFLGSTWPRLSNNRLSAPPCVVKYLVHAELAGHDGIYIYSLRHQRAVSRCHPCPALVLSSANSLYERCPE